MKRKIYSWLFACLLGSMLFACKSDEVNTNSVYLTLAEVNTTARLTVDNTGGAQAFSVTSTQPAAQAVTAQIAVDTTLIAAYNQRFGTAYQALPQGAYALSGNEVQIQPGMTVSDAVSFRVNGTELFEVGKAYMMPITIRNTSGLPLIESSRTIYLIINQVIITPAASLANNHFQVDFSQNNEALRAMSAITMETRVMVNSFQANSPFISSVMGIEETFLLRFGDVTVQPNQLQVAGGATATNVNFTFNTGTWYHIAAVYNGNQLHVYVDGTLLATKTASRVIDLNERPFYFGYSANGRRINGAISEARIWSRALSQGEISNGKCGVDPASAGLIGYWKFNAAEGKTVRDISGHNRDAVAANTIQWVQNVRCE
ncbi:DUF1735 and LamG domain-containing protein [Sphingobacterium suaedae]|uniref:DUF1735 and LamG domain-containing protein n=1 Tax=Sphingobacterium suaedae TaxID=1686402 RepID=A0ABW5KGW9_9SPHI